MNLTNTNLTNIVWIERGILLMILYTIFKNFSYLMKKSIVIKNKKLRTFVKKLFFSLNFLEDPEKNKSNNFYFNTRAIMKKKDIIIDYLNNYDDYIPAKKIWLVPYYDMNDPLIYFQYSNKNKIDVTEQREIIKKFSNQNRTNFFNNTSWDIYFENKVINKAKQFGITNFLQKINNFLTTTYTDTTGPKNYFTNIINPVVDLPQTKPNLVDTFSKKIRNLESNKIKLNISSIKNNDKIEIKEKDSSEKQVIDSKVELKNNNIKLENAKEDYVEEPKLSEDLKGEKSIMKDNKSNKNMIQLVNLINEKLENINKINEIMYSKKLKTKV